MSLSTSFALSQAANDAMQDESVKATAFALMAIREGVTDEMFQKLLFEFAANLTAVTASAITHVFMTEAQINEMIAEAMELHDLGHSIENE